MALYPFLLVSRTRNLESIRKNGKAYNQRPMGHNAHLMYSYEGYIYPKYCKCCMQEKLTFRLLCLQPAQNPAQTQGMHFVSVKHWNIGTHKLYRKINLWRITMSIRFNCFTCFETETWRKFAKSEHFSCFKMFQNKMKQDSGKGENTRPLFWCFKTLEQWII